MAITAKQVKELRERTGAGMLDCKKALTETAGDMEKAIDFLREKGMAQAAKKAGRTAAQGLIFDGVSADNKTAVILEFNSETDFVAKNDEFKNFGAKLIQLALNNDISTVEELAALDLDGQTVEAAITALIAKIGENMTLRRFEKVSSETGFVVTYNHLGGKLGVIVELAGEGNEEAISKAKDIAMHVAAMNPGYLKPEEVSTEDLDREKEIARKQLEAEGKPANIIENILKGKMNRFYQDNCLVKQVFVKAENKETVEQFAGENTVLRFDRYAVGEGIEVEETDFAAEVAAQLNA